MANAYRPPGPEPEARAKRPEESTPDLGKRSLAVILKGTAISVALYGIGIAFAISDEALAWWLCGLGSVIVSSVAVIRSLAIAISAEPIRFCCSLTRRRHSARLPGPLPSSACRSGRRTASLRGPL